MGAPRVGVEEPLSLAYHVRERARLYLQGKEQPMYMERGSTSTIFDDSSPRNASSTGNAAGRAGKSPWALLFEVKVGKGAREVAMALIYATGKEDDSSLSCPATQSAFTGAKSQAEVRFGWERPN